MDSEENSYFENEDETNPNLKSRTNHASNSSAGGYKRGLPPQPILKKSQIHRPFFTEVHGGMHDQLDHQTMSDQYNKANKSIPERVAQIYYSLGLFCSSHPWAIITLACIVVLISCYPLFSLSFLGYKPKEFVTPYDNYSVPPVTGLDGDWPRWYRGPPSTYIQQIIVKSAVVPWSTDLLYKDAFRGPLSQVFEITDVLHRFQTNNNITSLPKLCFSIGEVKSKVLKGKIAMLPENACLVVSPANFWHQKYELFKEDPDVLSTILNFRSNQRGKSGLAEIFLGMHVRDSGIRKHPFKPKPRIISYAITFTLQTFDYRFIEALKLELLKRYPRNNKFGILDKIGKNLSSNPVNPEILSSEDDQQLLMFHVYYPSQSSILQLIPLVITYIAMFVYVYFSVKKIDVITSKLGMAISALATVVASLCMSVGLCSHFGMTFEVNAKAIYPYLVVIIGLENILVLTRSVVSTAKNLDMKIRVAQGLSKEGWSITKNLLTEITILTIGFFTFMPAVQEFCILAIVGLLSDFFLQTLFFATVLSVDVHRQRSNTSDSHELRPLRTPIHPTNNGIPRIKSNPQIKPEKNGVAKSIVAPLHNTPILVKIPKRLRLVYFWARTRIFQRMFTIFMVGWISVIIYESGIVARFGHETEDVVIPLAMQNNRTAIPMSLLHSSNDKYAKPLVFSKENKSVIVQNTPNLKSSQLVDDLYSHNPYIWRKLTPYHWQVLFGVYNISLIGKYITILPPICISIPLSPKNVATHRNPNDFRQPEVLGWPTLTNALDTVDFVEDYDNTNFGIPALGKIKNGVLLSSSDDPYIPSSPIELALTVLLAIPSIFFISYLVVVLYRCICSRNYAEWRSSWTTKYDCSTDNCTQVVFEAQPLVLSKHNQDVECIGNDGNIIASVCLGGVLKVWHATTGENISTVDRKMYFDLMESKGIHRVDSCSPSTSPVCAGSPSDSQGLWMPEKMSRKQSSENLEQGISFQNHGDSRCSSKDEDSLDFSMNSPTGSVNIDDKTPLIGDLPSVWCLECQDDLIFMGTSSGRLEIWSAQTGNLKCIYDDGSLSGIVCIKLVGNRIILARLSGALDFVEFQYLCNSGSLENPFPYHRGQGDGNYENFRRTYELVSNPDSGVRCIWLKTQKAHQQPIVCLECEGGRILTGSQDHTLKVFRVEDHIPLYTLHGHYGPITCLFIDKYAPMTSGSGSQDGLLCVWDLLTGMCMYSIQAHDGPVNSLTYSVSYIISVGGDDKICVWERFQGHLLHNIPLDYAHCSSLVMLTQNLLITSKQGSLIIWDVRQGRPVRAVRLGHRDNAVHVRQIGNCADAILCDYGPQLRLVRFPAIVSKYD